MTFRDLFPSTADEVVAMFLCYAVVAAGFVLILNAHKLLGWVWRLYA